MSYFCRTIWPHRKPNSTSTSSSIDLASEDSESEAKGSVWFNSAKFPTARFVSTSIKNVGGDKYDVAGGFR